MRILEKSAWTLRDSVTRFFNKFFLPKLNLPFDKKSKTVSFLRTLSYSKYSKKHMSPIFW